jgi:hypothetical protein
MSLTLSTQPGFTELADNTFDPGNPATDTVMKQLNADAKFAAVRSEQFWGYYSNGETVALPVSAADGYQYQREELLYSHSWYWTGSATGPCAGTQTPPPRGATSGQGTLLQLGADVNQLTGIVSTVVSYYKSSEQDTNDGILLVITQALRMR